MALPASRPRSRTRKRRCLPSPTVRRSPTSHEGRSSVMPGFARPNGASRRSSSQSSSVSSRPVTTASTSGSRAQVVVAQRRVGVSGEGVRERLDPLGLDREAGSGAVAAEALEVLRAGGKPAVQVEDPGRAARPLPVAVRPGDQDDRPVESLHEPGRDDSDHALGASPRPRGRSRGGAASPPATRRPSRSPPSGSGPPRPGAPGSALPADGPAAPPRRDPP